MPRLILVLTAVLSLVVVSGCGGGGGGNKRSVESPGGGAESSSENIAAADVDQVLEAEESAQTACGLITNQEGSDMPLEEAVEILTQVLQESPEGVVAAGVQNRQRNMTTIVRDVSRTLATCPRPNREASQRLAQVLERYGAET